MLITKLTLVMSPNTARLFCSGCLLAITTSLSLADSVVLVTCVSNNSNKHSLTTYKT